MLEGKTVKDFEINLSLFKLFSSLIFKRGEIEIPLSEVPVYVDGFDGKLRIRIMLVANVKDILKSQKMVKEGKNETMSFNVFVRIEGKKEENK